MVAFSDGSITFVAIEFIIVSEFAIVIYTFVIIAVNFLSHSIDFDFVFCCLGFTQLHILVVLMVYLDPS